MIGRTQRASRLLRQMYWRDIEAALVIIGRFAAIALLATWVVLLLGAK